MSDKTLTSYRLRVSVAQAIENLALYLCANEDCGSTAESPSPDWEHCSPEQRDDYRKMAVEILNDDE